MFRSVSKGKLINTFLIGGSLLHATYADNAGATRSLSSPSTVRLALCQFKAGSDKNVNIARAAKAIDSATGAELVVLPEIWNSPYSTASFPQYAEAVPVVGGKPNIKDSPSIAMLIEKAKEKKIWLIGGSVPEKDEGKIYNTCIVVDPKGNIVAKHRKVHLFDIDVPGKIKFKESDSLTAGESPTIVETPWGLIGVGICYDIRFPEYAMLLRQLGARMLIYPGAFNMVTGPAHWELLQRARAVDNQLYVAACSPARDESGGYVAWGHSSVVSPWGEVVATTEEGEATVFADVDLKKVEEMRDSIPCWKQKRADLYSLESKYKP